MTQNDGIAIERSADQLEEIRRATERALAVCNLDRDYTQRRKARVAPRHPKRLAVVPWPPYGMACQEAVNRHLEAMRSDARNGLAIAA